MNEHLFKKLRSAVALHDTEKAASRERLRAYLAAHPAPTPSPYVSFFASLRYALAALLILGATGTGVTYAAEQAAPGDALYVIRVRVTEPARVALVRDPEKRTDLEVALVDRRLKELAQVSVKEKDTKVATLIIDSLSDRLEDTHKDIEKLRENKTRGLAAREAVAELRSTLAAHAEVLAHLDELQSEEVDAALITIASSTLAAKEVEEELAREPAEVSDPEEVREALTQEEEEVNETIADIAKELAEDSFDAGDIESIGTSLEQIKVIVDAATDLREKGDEEEALRLLGEVDEQTTRLKTLIEADQDLGIDLLD